MSFMLKEILEQPQALPATFRAERAHALEFMKFALQQNFRLVVLVARGTSDNAARFARYLTEITTGIPASLGEKWFLEHVKKSILIILVLCIFNNIHYG